MLVYYTKSCIRGSCHINRQSSQFTLSEPGKLYYSVDDYSYHERDLGEKCTLAENFQTKEFGHPPTFGLIISYFKFGANLLKNQQFYCCFFFGNVSGAPYRE